jgi:hypothetical protein
VPLVPASGSDSKSLKKRPPALTATVQSPLFIPDEHKSSISMEVARRIMTDNTNRERWQSMGRKGPKPVPTDGLGDGEAAWTTRQAVLKANQTLFVDPRIEKGTSGAGTLV